MYFKESFLILIAILVPSNYYCAQVLCNPITEIIPIFCQNNQHCCYIEKDVPGTYYCCSQNSFCNSISNEEKCFCFLSLNIKGIPVLCTLFFVIIGCGGWQFYKRRQKLKKIKLNQLLEDSEQNQEEREKQESFYEKQKLSLLNEFQTND